MEKEIHSFEEFQQEIASGLVLVDFYAPCCGACRMLAPIVSQIAEEHPEIKVLRVYVDAVEQLAAAYSISSIPTLIKFQDGHAVDSSTGYLPKRSKKKYLR